MGVSLSNVTILRLDRCGGAAPGNKVFKLRHYLEQARAEGVSRLVSFGGAWSNHLHALAAVGAEQGFETIGLVRGELHDTPMLEDAKRLGMHIEHLDRREYRLRNEQEYLEQVRRRFGNCLLVPEGGSGAKGAAGCVEIGRFLREECGDHAHVLLAVGTGTTLAGVAAGLGSDGRVTGISALKGVADLEGRVEQALSGLDCDLRARWQIQQDFHCGGFARVSPQLQEFMLTFEAVHDVPLEPVYTGKLFFAVHRMLSEEILRQGEPLVLVHTGGLQGRRGYSWLARK